MNVTVKIQNIDEIRSAFSKAPAKMVVSLDKAIKKSVFSIQSQSQRNAPVDTGRLRASHMTGFGTLMGFVQPTANYAIFVHEGTRFMSGRPFLLEAVQSEDQKVQGYFKDAVQDVLNDIARDV